MVMKAFYFDLKHEETWMYEKIYYLDHSSQIQNIYYNIQKRIELHGTCMKPVLQIPLCSSFEKLA